MAVSPSTVYGILQDVSVLHRWNRGHTSGKGQGSEQPVKPHEHWHIDISYIIHGTFYYLCSVLRLILLGMLRRDTALIYGV